MLPAAVAIACCLQDICNVLYVSGDISITAPAVTGEVPPCIHAPCVKSTTHVHNCTWSPPAHTHVIYAPVRHHTEFPNSNFVTAMLFKHSHSLYIAWQPFVAHRHTRQIC